MGFILTILGIDQIPGEYWTAASLAEPDQDGLTWMDYQGYSLRRSGDKPLTGDLLVLAGGAQVVTVQEWNSMEHLVPVPVDVWAGHIGIVLGAGEVILEGTEYFNIRLLSANWGVNSSYLGVVGSCYNVDSSEFLVEKDDESAKFFYASDPRKERERMVNRAERWAMLGLRANSGASLDGFPVTPSGFISDVMQPVGAEPLIPTIWDVAAEMVQITPESLLPGDFVLFGDPVDPGLGVVVDPGMVIGGRTWTGSLIYLEAEGRATGPAIWTASLIGEDWVRNNADTESTKIKFLRYKGIPAYLGFSSNEPLRINNREGNVELELFVMNSGGMEMDVSSILLTLFQTNHEEDRIPPKSVNRVILTDLNIHLVPGQSYHVFSEIDPIKPGEYGVSIEYQTTGAQNIKVGEVLLTVD